MSCSFYIRQLQFGGKRGYVLTNAASVQNKGYELALNWRDKKSKDFSYSIGVNFTFNQNTVVGLNGGQAYIDGPVGADQPYVTRTDNGHPIGSFYVQKVSVFSKISQKLTNMLIRMVFHFRVPPFRVI